MSLTANVPRMVVAVVGVLLAVFVFGTSVKQCTEENVKECAKPMLEKTGNDTDSPIIPTRTEDEMRKRCSDYQDFEECLHPMKPNCTKVEQLVFEGIERYFDYFCDQKFDEYLKYRECFKNGTLHEEGKFCNTFKRRLMNLQINNVSHLHNRICQYVEDYLDCVENVVTSFCGKEAARWQRGLDVRSIEPILSEAQCPGWLTYICDLECLNGGTCIAGKYKEPGCLCYKGYEGQRCEIKSAKKKYTLAIGLVGFFLLLLLIVGVLLVMKLRQMKKNNHRQTATYDSLESPSESVVVPYATYNARGVYMSAGVPPPGANPQGAAVAGPLPMMAPEYPESLPPTHDSAGYENPLYGANPRDL